MGLFVSMPASANEKVSLCKEYKKHLSFMKDIQSTRNFDLNSTQWQKAKTKQVSLENKGKEFYGDAVTLKEVCAGLLQMINLKQYNNYK